KALEWQTPLQGVALLRAEGIGIFYEIFTKADNQLVVTEYGVQSKRELCFGRTLDATKAVAQANYEARIRSALVPIAPAGEPLTLSKRPVAFRLKDYADGWILFNDEEKALRVSEHMGALMQGLYVRDDTPLVAPAGEAGWRM